MQTYAPRLRELTLTYRVRRSIAGDEIRFGGCVTDGDEIRFGGCVTDADDAAKLLIAILADEPSEVYGMLCVTPRQRIIGYHEVSRGPPPSESHDANRSDASADARAVSNETRTGRWLGRDRRHPRRR